MNESIFLRRWVIVFLAAIALVASPALAADTPPPAAPAKPVLRTRLPDEKPHQQALRKYIGSLTEQDFDHGVKEDPKTPAIDSAEDLYRAWILAIDFPRVGVIHHGLRNNPGANLPASNFTLAAIEDANRGVIKPSIWPEPVVWLANWKYPGNPYFSSRALKLRAFVTATVGMLMMDDQQEHSPMLLYHRSDWFGPHLMMYGYVLTGVGDAVAPEARAAYAACLKIMMQRVSTWGPRGDEGYLDITAVLGMRLAADALKDPEASRLAEAYAKRFFSDPWYYHPAGYFPEQGCFDAGFNGLSLYYATWLALQAPDWDFVQDAVKKAWQLRGELVLPEPDGQLTGASHTNSRTGSDVVKDQWDWPFRTVAASFLTDDAICQAPFPTVEQLKTAPEEARALFASYVHNFPSDDPGVRSPSISRPWAWMLYPDTPEYPVVNFADEFYPKGFFAKREALAKSNSPLLKYPFQRGDSFVHAHDKAFLIAKKPTFGVIVHTGPVSEFKGEGHVEFTGPYGLSGGSLSAFWTPATGAVILGRRAGMQFPDRKPANFDLPEAWRTWPVHAVTGVTAAGKLFTSARIQNPDATFDVSNDKATVKVAGVIPPGVIGTENSLEGKLDFARTFTVDDKGVSIETMISGDGKDSIAELYEVIPVYHGNLMTQPKVVPTTIEFESAGKWAPATEQYADAVTAVRLTRFAGAVAIRFDRPRRAKLSPTDWTDTFMTRASCRNLLVDMIESGDKPMAVKDARKVVYRIEAIGK